LSTYPDVAHLLEGIALKVFYYNNRRIHTVPRTAPRAYTDAHPNPKLDTLSIF
jgi:hypothetical protein